MRILETIDEIRDAVARARKAGRAVGLVPTMGFLHEGHLALVRRAREHGAAGESGPFIVLSVFVNPAQFGPGEDFDDYPRSLERDAALARDAGVNVLFAPSAEEMYPEGFRTHVDVTEITEPLCGQGRPGHFEGVALVVTKLLNIVRPDFSVFGRKDAQQLVLIRRLASDLNLPGEILDAPIVREADGLAMSSRNVNLGPGEREAALAIGRGLAAAEHAWGCGERRPSRLVAIVRESIDAADLLEAEYVEIVTTRSLEPWVGSGPALLAVGVRAGDTRLIDNVILGSETSERIDASDASIVAGG